MVAENLERLGHNAIEREKESDLSRFDFYTCFIILQWGTIINTFKAYCLLVFKLNKFSSILSPHLPPLHLPFSPTHLPHTLSSHVLISSHTSPNHTILPRLFLHLTHFYLPIYPLANYSILNTSPISPRPYLPISLSQDLPKLPHHQSIISPSPPYFSASPISTPSQY